MKKGCCDHPKTLELARRLGISRRDCVGLLELLFDFVSSYCQDGIIGRFTNAQLAEALDWEGSDRRLVSALVQCGGKGGCGYLERHAAHRLIVHDWQEHAPEYLKRRAREGHLTFADPESVNHRSITGQSPENDRPTMPDQTRPCHAEPDQAPPPSAEDIIASAASGMSIDNCPAVPAGLLASVKFYVGDMNPQLTKEISAALARGVTERKIKDLAQDSRGGKKPAGLFMTKLKGARR